MFPNTPSGLPTKEIKRDKLEEVKRMSDFNRVSYFTSFHQDKTAFLDPQFNLNSSFTERMFQMNMGIMVGKVALITGASAGFGIAMGFIMSGFEFNSTRVVDTTRSNRSQIKQHFFGYARFLKRNALHFARFGLYISLIEIPLEVVIGRLPTPAIFFSGGAAAVLQNRFLGWGNAFSHFMGSGIFIGGLGLVMNRGKD